METFYSTQSTRKHAMAVRSALIDIFCCLSLIFSVSFKKGGHSIEPHLINSRSLVNKIDFKWNSIRAQAKKETPSPSGLHSCRLQFAFPKKCPEKQTRAHNSDEPQTGDLATRFMRAGSCEPFHASRFMRTISFRLEKECQIESRKKRVGMAAVSRRASEIKQNAIGFHWADLRAIVCRRITRCEPRKRPEQKMKTNICSMPRVWSYPFPFSAWNIIHHSVGIGLKKKIKRNFYFPSDLLRCVSAVA